MESGKVTSNGRIIIPALLRQKYKLTPGRKVKFEIRINGIKLNLIVTSKRIQTNVGFLKTKSKLLKPLMEEKKREKSV